MGRDRGARVCVVVLRQQQLAPGLGEDKNRRLPELRVAELERRLGHDTTNPGRLTICDSGGYGLR